MKNPLAWLSVLAVLLSMASGFAAEKPAKAKKGANGLEVLVGADAVASPDGLRPKPDQPIHYIFNQTRLTLGDAIAGVKLPDVSVVERAVVAELANQGFVRTQVGGPMPALMILAVVGDSNFEEPPRDDLDLEPYREMVNTRVIVRDNLLNLSLERDQERLAQLVEEAAVRMRYRQSLRFRDKEKIQSLLGFEKVDRGIRAGALTASAAERFAWAAYENRLYVTLNAFDAERWAKKEKVLLWRTTMSIDWREDLAVALPKMLAQAGPLFGTDAALPAFVDDRDRRKAEVEIGEATVVPDATKRNEAGGEKK